MKLTARARKVVDMLAAGSIVERTKEGWMHGRAMIALAVVHVLLGADLVREEAGRLWLTPAGRSLAGTSASARPARLLAERNIPDDAPTTAPAKHARRSVTVNLLESPLGWLLTRGLIDQRRFDAGERLRADWTMAGLGARVTMRWDASPTARGPRGPGQALDPTLAAIAAKRRFEGAVAAAGAGLSDILWRVVCSGEGLEAAEAALGWPRRAGKLVLLMALERVADYYGIA